METIQVVARGQEIMAKIEEDMKQRSIVASNPDTIENPAPPQGNPHVQIPTTTPCIIPPPIINPLVIEIDDQHDAFFSPIVGSIYDTFGSPANEVEKKV